MDKAKNNKRKTRRSVPMFAVISVAVFLLAGCRQGNHKEHSLPPQVENGKQTEAQADSLKEDSIKAHQRRMIIRKIAHSATRHYEFDR